MYRTGHVGLALLCWVPVAATLVGRGAFALAVAGGVVCVWLATLPDVDHALPAIRHRGPTHSVAFALVVAVGVATVAVWTLDVLGSAPDGFGQLPIPLDRAAVRSALAALLAAAVESASALPQAGPNVSVLALAAATAVLSHLLGDLLTPAGVELLWPISRRRFSVGLVRAESALANYALLLAGVGALALLVHGPQLDPSGVVQLPESPGLGEIPIG